jgi:hypothetical protein
MKCKHCGGEIIRREIIRSNDYDLAWKLVKDYPAGYWYSCYKNDNDAHEPEEKSNNFKLIYDILNDTTDKTI